MKHRHTIVFLLAFCFLVAGCWDHQPPENSAFIISIGLDEFPEDPSQTAITQLAVLPGALAPGENGGGAPEGTPFYLLSNNAHTLEAAQMAVVDHLSRLPRLEHLGAIVFGQQFARQNVSVEPAIAWALRHPQIRPGVLLFVAEESAQSFLDAHPALDPLPGEALMGLMRQSERVPYVFPVRTYEFARTLLSPRIDGAVPIVDRVDPLAARVPPGFQQMAFVGSTGDEGENGDTNSPTETQVKLTGMAVFKGPRMVGALKGEDGDGLRWIEGGSKAVVSVPHPADPGISIVAITIKQKVQRRARLEGDGAVLTIKTYASMDIWGEGKLEPMAVSRHVESIERALSDVLVKKIRRTMTNLQQLETDIFGFGEELYRTAPDDWDKVEHRWDEVYADAALEINVDIGLRRTGLSR